MVFVAFEAFVNSTMKVEQSSVAEDFERLITADVVKLSLSPYRYVFND